MLKTENIYLTLKLNKYLYLGLVTYMINPTDFLVK